jgi:hypothetical protein
LGQVRSTFSTFEISGFPVVLGFVILVIFPEILRQMSEDGGRVAGPSFKSRDAA